MKIFLFAAILVTAAGAQSTVTICANHARTITYTAYKTFSQVCPCISNTLDSEEATYKPTTSGAVRLPGITISLSSTSSPGLISEPAESTQSTILLNTLSVNFSSSTSSTVFTTAIIPSQNPVLSSKVVSGTTLLTVVSSSEIQSDNLTSLPSPTTSLNPLSSTPTQSILSITTRITSPSNPSFQSSSTSDLSSAPTGLASLTSSIPHSSTTSFSLITRPLLPVVTDQAYINTVIRHHNVHRLNHTASSLIWSFSLAETARKIASSCRYGHVVDIDGGGYGQNIGAGYYPDQMGLFVTEGLYNSEVNNYIYYGMEPNITTLNGWGHFSQIVWKPTASVGCYTQDCTSPGLANVGSGVAPYFTVCNYAPPGNVIGEFAQNVGPGVGLPTVHQYYGCPTEANCI